MSANNPPAFPRPLSNDETPNTGTYPGNRIEFSEAQDGMSLRDYFAAAVAAQLCVYTVRVKDDPLTWEEIVAHDAYKIADAMLKAREQGAKP